MRTLSLIAASAALIASSAGTLQGQSRDSVIRAGVESVLGSIERTEMRNDGRGWNDERGESPERWAWERETKNRGRYESRRDRDRDEKRWRKQKERELRSCERDLWSRVRHERDRWDDGRDVRSTKDRIHRICERRDYGWGQDGDGRIFDRNGR